MPAFFIILFYVKSVLQLSGYLNIKQHKMFIIEIIQLNGMDYSIRNQIKPFSLLEEIKLTFNLTLDSLKAMQYNSYCVSTILYCFF